MDEEKRPDDRREGGKKRGKSDVWLTVIGIGKLIKVAVLVSVGIAALVAVNDGPPQVIEHIANIFGVEHGSHHLQRLVARVAGVPAKKLEEICFGSFVYAALFATEGTGLLLKKKWGEYLTIVITTSFLPLEIYEIVHRGGAAKVVTLVLNVIVVIYLLLRLLRDRREKRAKRKGADVSDRGQGRRPAPAPLGIASR